MATQLLLYMATNISSDQNTQDNKIVPHMYIQCASIDHEVCYSTSNLCSLEMSLKKINNHCRISPR